MTEIQVRKCRSKNIPCPAGDRCPEHRDQILALNQAARNRDFETFSKLKEKDRKLEIARGVDALMEKPVVKDAPETVTGIPASEYATYQTEAIRILDGIGKLIELAPENEKFAKGESAKFLGRDGATYFEKAFLKPILFGERKPEFIENMNSASDSKFQLVDIVDPEADFTGQGDGSNRTFSDIDLILKDKDGNVSSLPVNIKATNGGSADNVGGWAAFEFIMFGNVRSSPSKSKTLARITPESIKATTVSSDYFLWSFLKGGEKPFHTAHSVSLFEYDPTFFSFNASQSFPLQANVIRLVKNREVLDPTISLEERRTKWAVWINKLYYNYYSKNAAAALKQLAPFIEEDEGDYL
jgi:hypothetical protein